MSWLALKLSSWLIHALVVMVSVAAVSKGNTRNTLPRALLVTCTDPEVDWASGAQADWSITLSLGDEV